MKEELTQWLPILAEPSLAAFAMLALVFSISGLILIPRTFLCLGAGAIFGPSAILIILPSTTFGGVIAFLLARYFLAERLRHRFEQTPLLHAIMDAIDSESWRIVGLLRFGSPVPTTVQNYLFGLTRIGLWHFTIASFVFTIPQACLYVYLGAEGRAALLDDSSSALSRCLVAIGAISLLTAMILLTRKVRMALLKGIEGGRTNQSKITAG